MTGVGSIGVRYGRVVLKMSGEAFGPEAPDDNDAPGPRLGLVEARVERVAREIQSVRDAGVELAVVVGGGNLIRGRALVGGGIHPVTADMMGMLATVINGLALRNTLENIGVEAALLTALDMPAVAERYHFRKCLRRMERGEVVVLAGGTGSPHFTTDTGAALRARELSADAAMKATNVDGVYSDDPKTNPDAERYSRLTFDEALERGLRVMDQAAFALCREGGIPIIVFDLGTPGNCLRAVRGEPVGTVVEGESKCR